MTEELNLFIDEYPADLYQSMRFCIAIADVPDGLSIYPSSFDGFEILKKSRISAYVGYVDASQEPKVLDYLKRRIFDERDGIRGVNMFWSTVTLYCIFGFIVKFYKFIQPPPINVFHDPKAMSKDHRSATYDFLKAKLPTWFDVFSEGRVRPQILTVQEGSKNSQGLKIADFLAREFLKNGAGRLETFDSIMIQDLSRHVVKNPEQLRF